MSENPHQDIIDGSMAAARNLYQEEWSDSVSTIMGQIIGSGIMQERVRCLTIIQSIETTSAQGKRVIDEIVRKVRCEE